MVDTQSQLRLKRIGPSSVEVRQSFPSYHLLNTEFAHRRFTTQHPPAHSCRPLHNRESHDSQHWPAFLLTFGLKQTQEDALALHYKERRYKSIEQKPQDRLLHSVGQRGTAEGFFNFPRGLGVSAEGDLAVADTDNHRVQIFNAAGVFKGCLGRGRGSGPGELLRPQDVAWMPTGNFAVADTGNCRVQIFRPRGNIRMMFLTRQEPVAIHCDSAHNLVIVNERRQVELYRKGGKFERQFPLGGTCASAPLSVTSDTRLICVCDTGRRLLLVFNYLGQPVVEFCPAASRPGLSSIPVGVDFLDERRLVVADALNHTVSVYDVTGEHLRQVLGPTDDLGCVQTVRGTPEGHLAVTEFAANGLHCLKVFRHLRCRCHTRRPGSSKKEKSTPIPKDHFLSDRVVPQL